MLSPLAETLKHAKELKKKKTITVLRRKEDPYRRSSEHLLLLLLIPEERLWSSLDKKAKEALTAASLHSTPLLKPQSPVKSQAGGHLVIPKNYEK